MKHTWMGSKGHWNPRKEVRELVEFILNHPSYLYPLMNSLKQVNPSSSSYNSMHIESILMEYTSMVSADPKITEEFQRLLESFINIDIKTSGQSRGDLLEYICYQKGPFKPFPYSVTERLRKCYMVDPDQGKMCGEKDLDIGFINADTGYAQVLECKCNLTNFLHGCKERHIDKIRYMDCISRRMSDADESGGGSLLLITLQTSVVQDVDNLSELGFELTVFGYNEVYKLIV